MNKLILVEGLPSTGKSTTAKAINEIFSRMNYDTELYFEGDHGHPVDYDGVAYFNPDEFKSLKEKHSDKKEVLDDLKGIDGTIQILKEREKRETDIVECIEINKHIVNNSKLEAVVLNDRLISILGNYYK